MRPISSGWPIAAAFSIIFLLPAISQAQSSGVPDSLFVQGVLTDTNGVVVPDGNYSVQFKLYKNGAPVWDETHGSVAVSNGVFNVLLGGTNPFDTMAFNSPLDLGITVGDDPEMNPRTALAAAPFALGLRGMYVVWSDDGGRMGYNVIGGGPNNRDSVGVVGATISGGGGFETGSPTTKRNEVVADWGSIGGGRTNRVSGFAGTVSGGQSNIASDRSATVAGGEGNRASNQFATVSGGNSSEASGLYATVGGGFQNKAGDDYSAVTGGQNNSALKDSDWVGGGRFNKAQGGWTTICGGDSNSAAILSFIGGGRSNFASGSKSVIGGGESNSAQGFASIIGGGFSNQAGGLYSSAGGGRFNVANGSHATVLGGFGNEATNSFAAVVAGINNTAGGVSSTVGGGDDNTAGGEKAVVPGGSKNAARGAYSFAAGYNARSLHAGSFVWNDRSQTAGDLSDSLVTTGTNQFLIRADGGVGIGTNAPAHPLHVGNDSTNGNGAHVTAVGNWTNASSRSAKKGFEIIDKSELLLRLSKLSVTKWQYHGERGVSHIGPVAEDFRAVFGLGASDRYITTVDADGVALAAIQGLYELVQTQQAEIERLKETVENLR